MGFNIVYLDSNGNQASKIERKTVCISVPTQLQVGAVANISVTVENTGPGDCVYCTVLFYYERSGDAAPTAIVSSETAPSNPPPSAGLNGTGPNNTATFAIAWTIPANFDGAGVIYAQIQTQNPPPYVDPTNMNLSCNAERNVYIQPLAAVRMDRARKEGGHDYAE